VTGVLMPSRYSSRPQHHRRRGVGRQPRDPDHDHPDRAVHRSFLDLLAEPFAGTRPAWRRRTSRPGSGDDPHGPVQQFNWLVLTTGNKSEMATGYSTLYGDMAGGFAP